MENIQLLDADITTLAVDAIVNAANPTLLGGGGVDGAIHAAAGPGLLSECRRIGGCPVGGARITSGHELPVRYVIHTVGPVWRDGGNNEEQLLASCYRECFALAREHGIKTIAFPAVGTGVYGFPKEAAARICVRECRAALEGENACPQRIILVCFNPATRAAYLAAMRGPDHDSTGGVFP